MTKSRLRAAFCWGLPARVPIKSGGLLADIQETSVHETPRFG